MNGYTVHIKHMDIDDLNRFKERIKTINEINGGTREPTYLFITKSKATYAKFLSFANLKYFDYLIVFGERKWKNGSYVNTSAVMLGMFTWEHMGTVEKIPLENGYSIKDVLFTHYKNEVTPAEYKPKFVVEAPDGTESEVELEDEEPWDTAFVTLFNKANALKFTPKPAKE